MANGEIGGIPVGECRTGFIKGQQVAIFNVDGELYATQTECTHRGGPLCEGSLTGDVVTCPWHGSQFNIRTGEVVSGPAEEPLKTYTLEFKDGKLLGG